MPYTTVVAGTTITASWGNANVRDQGVTPFASASARTSAVTTPIEGMLSYLSDVNQLQYYDGANWAPVPGQYMSETTTNSADVVQAAGANTILISNTFSAVNGSRYEAHFESTYQYSVGNFAIVGFRHASGSSVTTASTLVGNSQVYAVSTAVRTPFSMTRTLVAAATGTYTIGVSSNFFNGSGNLTWSANSSGEMYLRIRSA